MFTRGRFVLKRRQVSLLPLLGEPLKTLNRGFALRILSKQRFLHVRDGKSEVK